ncbi:MAG: hypothetical protein ACOC5J_01680 [Gemmatimonadota bacterium]
MANGRSLVPRVNVSPAPRPESVVRGERDRALRTGSRVQRQGIQAIEEFDPEQFLGADALSAMFDQATVTNLVPQLRSLQARNAQRNVRGPLAGALEGDLASAFRRDLLSQVAQAGGERARLGLQRGTQLAEFGGAERAQGLSLLGTELELQLAREQARRERRSGIGGLIGTGLGALAGTFIPGVGNALGAQIGGAIGGGAGRAF